MLGSVVAFSFPLCGYAQEDWSVGETSRFLSRQVVEFSSHLGDLEITALLGMFWGLKIILSSRNGTACCRSFGHCGRLESGHQLQWQLALTTNQP